MSIRIYLLITTAQMLRFKTPTSFQMPRRAHKQTDLIQVHKYMKKIRRKSIILRKALETSCSSSPVTLNNCATMQEHHANLFKIKHRSNKKLDVEK